MSTIKKRKKSSPFSKIIRAITSRKSYPGRAVAARKKKSSSKSSKPRAARSRVLKTVDKYPNKTRKELSKSGGGKGVARGKKRSKKSVSAKAAPGKRKRSKKQTTLARSRRNPIISPIRENEWESWQTFNPAALFENGKVHFLYRALGPDGVSRLGHATSRDGIRIDERWPQPAYVIHKKPESSKADSLYSMLPYTSGGGWAGCEDPRLTRIKDTVYLLYVAFDEIGLPRLALTSINLEDFLAKRWKWAGARIISPPGVIDKSGVLFPEKIKGKYVIMHRIFPNILIDFVDNLDFKEGECLEGKYSIKIRKKHWDSRKIGAGAPPIKTKYGWLLIYYAVDNKDPGKYKIGAMLLDLKNPVKVLYRTAEPILEPVKWYENEGHKAGVIYPCGAVVKNGKLFVYYGGADSYACVAHASLEKFLQNLMRAKTPKLSHVRRKNKKSLAP